MEEAKVYRFKAKAEYHNEGNKENKYEDNSRG